jgi:hypothetical protein
MNLYELLSDLEDNDDLHEGRLVLLLKAFAGESGDEAVEGLTKLAKLDFLLRYPTYLERALAKRPGGKPAKALVKDHERQSVESSMVRFKYGPWDHRYRRFLNLLVGKGLAKVTVDGRTINIGLTPRGIEAANQLAEDDANQDIVQRAAVLKRHFDLTATNLMKFIYETFPEIGTLRLGTEIGHEY